MAKESNKIKLLIFFDKSVTLLLKSRQGVAMKNVFRVRLLIGLILSAVLYAYSVISLGLLSLSLWREIFNTDNIAIAIASVVIVIVVISLLIGAVFALVGLILACCGFSRVKMQPEKFQKKKGVLIACVVFNFLLVFISLLGSTESVMNPLTIVCMIAYIVSAILIIIDIRVNKKLLSESQSAPSNEPVQNDSSQS